MYAVVATGGRQLKVAAGDVVRVQRLDGEIGDTVSLDEVKLLATESGLITDIAKLASAKVSCTITDQNREKKIRVFKKKRRKNYSRQRGHRQYYTELKINAIEA